MVTGLPICVTLALDEPRALADAMVALASMEPAERRAMGARARAYGQGHHELGALADRLGACLRDLTGAQRAAPPPGA